MVAHKDSFAQRIRVAARKLRHDQFAFADLSHAADLKNRAEEKKMRSTVDDFLKRGEMARIRPGLYRYVGRRKDTAETEKRVVMWRILKMRRTVTVEDLMEMAGVSKRYACEWLQMLVKQEVVTKIQPGQPGQPAIWRLIKDVARMPENTAKAAYLRGLREKQKQAMTLLGQATRAINKANNIIKEIKI